MRLKRSLILLSSIFLVDNSLAAIAEGSGSFGGVLPLIGNILGINVNDPYQIIGVLASFGIISLINYIMLKKAFKKLDMLEVVNLGGSTYDDDSRNILAILSVLMTLSIVGTGAFMGIINGFRQIILLLFSFILLGGTAIVLTGGTGLTVGGVSWVTGKSAKAGSKGLKSGAEAFDDSIPDEYQDKMRDMAESAGQRIRQGVNDLREGNYEGAIQDVEEAEMMAEEIEKEMKSGEDEINHELDEDLQRVQHMLDEESEEEELVEDIHKRTERISGVLRAWEKEMEQGQGAKSPGEYLNNECLLKNPGAAGVPADYGMDNLEEDIEMIMKKDLSVINEDIAEEESELKKELENLKGTLEASQQLTNWIGQLNQFLEQIDEEGEEMEELGQKQNFQKLFQEAENIEQEDSQLKERIDYLEKELQEIEEKQEEAIELLNKHYEFGEEEIQNLKEDLTLENKVEQVIHNIIEGLAQDGRFKGQDGSTQVYHALERVQDQIGEIESILKQELGEKEDEESTINEAADTLSGAWESAKKSSAEKFVDWGAR